MLLCIFASLGACVCLCVCACLLLSLGLSWCVWWWGWWAVKHLSLFLPKWFPWWTTIRWQGPAGSILTKKKKQQNKTKPPHTHLLIVLSPLLCLWLSERRQWIPFLEKSPKAKSDEFENRLDDKNHSKDVVAILQYLLKVLQNIQAHTHSSCTLLHYYGCRARSRGCYHGYLGLVVVLHTHGEEVCEDDDCDEKIQVVAGAHGVYGSAPRGIISIIRLLLGLCIMHTHTHRGQLLKETWAWTMKSLMKCVPRGPLLCQCICVCWRKGTTSGIQSYPSLSLCTHTHTHRHTAQHLKVSLSRNPYCLSG